MLPVIKLSAGATNWKSCWHQAHHMEKQVSYALPVIPYKTIRVKFENGYHKNFFQ